MAESAEKLGLDVAVEGFKKFISQMGVMDKSIGATSGMWNGLSKAAKGTMGVLGKVAKVGLIGVAGGAVAAAGAIGGVTLALGKMAMEAAPVQGLKGAFDGLTASFEGGSDAMLKSLQEASGGMIANRDLMESFNKASSLVSVDFAQKLPDAMGYLSKVAASTGQDMGYLMDSLVTGVGRVSPMILDNLAIQVDAVAANEAYAASIGKSVDDLTKQEKQTAMMNQVLEKLAENTASMPDVTGSATQGMASFGTMIQNLKDDIGLAFLPVLQIVMGELSKLASKIGPKVTEWARIAGKWLGEKLPWAINAIQGAFESFLSGDITWGMEYLKGLIVTLFGAEGAKVFDTFKEKLIAVGTWIRDTLIPAFQDLGLWIQDTVIPAIQTLGIWIQDNLVPAFQALSVWIQETAIPAFQQFVTFIQENAEPILAGIAAVLVAVVIPAFVAWAAGAISAAVATVVALGPIILILAAIGAAVALLVKAWQEDWGGIQEKTAIAVAFLKQLWDEVLLPAIQQIWGFIRLQLIPLFKELARIAVQIVGRAIEQLTDIWNNVLYPILVTVWEFIQESLIPLFIALADVAEAVLGLAIKVLAGIWQNVLYPALKKVWEFIEKYVLPTFIGLRKEIDEKLGPVLKWITEKVLPQLQKGFELIQYAVLKLVEYLEYLKKLFERMRVPDWAKGGSPPPLATWFQDISNEVQRLAAAELPRLAASFDLVGGQAVPAYATGGASVTNNYNTSNSYNLTTQSVNRPGGLAMEFSSMEMATR